MVVEQVVLPLHLSFPLLVLVPAVYLRSSVHIFGKVVLVLFILFFLLVV
jgi:hypothetical protein